MSNPFEKNIISSKASEKQDVCKHGNLKDFCDFCRQDSGNEKIKEAPENWKTFSALAHELNIARPTLRIIAEPYRSTNPEFFADFKESGRVREHCSPQLIEIIQRNVNNNQEIEGWMTNKAIARELGFDYQTVKRVSNKYRLSNPEYFKKIRSWRGDKQVTYYSSILASLIKSELLSRKESPGGWKTNSALAGEMNVDFATIKRIVGKYKKSNPEYFQKFRSKGGGSMIDYYSPQLVSLIVKELSNREKAPEGWKTYVMISIELNNHSKILEEKLRQYGELNPEWTGQYYSRAGKISEFYAPQLVNIVRKELEQTKEAPEDWKTLNRLAKDLNSSEKSIIKIAEPFKITNPEYFEIFRAKRGGVFEHFAPQLVEIIREKTSEVPKAPTGWETSGSLATELGLSKGTPKIFVEQYRETNPEYFANYIGKSGRVHEHYSPQLVDIIKENFKIAPEGWKNINNLVSDLGIGRSAIEKIIETFKESHSDYFHSFRGKNGITCNYYSPELVEIIIHEIEARKRSPREDEQEELKQSLDNFIQEMATENTQDERAKELREIIGLLPENACDILFKYHPEYKGIRVEYAKKVIAEYLGDFLLVKKPWNLRDINLAKDLFSDESFAQALFMKFKDASYAFYQKEKKANRGMSERDLVMKYFEDEKLVEATARIPEVQKTLDRLKSYYEDLFRLANKKPDNIVDSLKPGRVFPDINQLINLKEIADNKKMLIADEMGLGKSASAILAKEYLGLRQGLIVAPSNVISTWERYLSSAKDENGNQAGYFKPGLEPKVLIIDNPKDIDKLSQSYDYILISQEKLNERYTEALEKIDFDMLIVDEVHKLKNIEEGTRSENIIKLAGKIQGDEKYLTLLSGTPAPNKVKDFAITLKLLYPEKYEKMSDKDLVRRIIYGDLVDLREELFSRMQMKELATAIEMPPLEEQDILIKLTDPEKEVYQILLEEDALTASEKIIVFRQFLLSPQLLSIEPGFEGSKVKELRETLSKDLDTKNKIIVFVNGYIEGVIRGQNNIIDKIQPHLHSDVIIKTIHGEIKNAEERKQTESDLKHGDKKMVVFVSGQTADVGVDFSGADEVIFYNEPWSTYEKRQQRGRSYREGLKGLLAVKTLLVDATIEEGIHRYAKAKERAIEKLLRGIERTRAENILLEKDSRSRMNDVETNEDLSRQYMSDWEKLMLHFGEGWEAGDEWFRNMPEEKKDNYAQLYKNLGGLTYQGNNARVSATLIANMMKERPAAAPEEMRILDIASGPEMLKRHVSKEFQGRLYSFDINEKHFEDAIDRRRTFKTSYLDIPAKSNSVDYCNIGFAFHQTKAIKYYKKNYERLQVLAEMNRVLKPGGRLVISEVYNIEFSNFGRFEELVKKLGFKMVKEYTGLADGGENYRAHFITLEKAGEIAEYKGDQIKFNDPEKRRRYIRALGDKLGRELLSGLEMKKITKSSIRLRDQRRMIDKFKLSGKERNVLFSDPDRYLLIEERQAIQDGEDLKQKYNGIENIPLEEIKSSGFERKLETPGYFLLYKIIKDGGAVVIRGDRKKSKSVPKNI